MWCYLNDLHDAESEVLPSVSAQETDLRRQRRVILAQIRSGRCSRPTPVPHAMKDHTIRYRYSAALPSPLNSLTRSLSTHQVEVSPSFNWTPTQQNPLYRENQKPPNWQHNIILLQQQGVSEISIRIGRLRTCFWDILNGRGYMNIRKLRQKVWGLRRSVVGTLD